MCSVMIDLLQFGSLLEFILLLLVIFIVTVYWHQRLSMETIWGDRLYGLEGDPATPSEDIEELTGEIDEAYYEDNCELSSDEEFRLVDGEKITTRNKDIETTSSHEKIGHTYNENLSEVNLKSTTFDDKDLSCTEGNSKIATDIAESTGDEENPKTTAQAIETTDGNLDSVDKNKYVVDVTKFTQISEYEGDSVVKLVDLSNKMSKVFEVNSSTFVAAEQQSHHDDDELTEYELYRMDAMTEDNDDEDMISKLDIHIRTLPQGVIINSNVFLWDAQWHTMALLSEDLFRCAVCRVYCNRVTCVEHIATISHIRNLDKHRPLKRFDLSIVRKMNNNLHCAVCNDIFDIIDCKAHENGKKHEENLLTAINKVSDFSDDSNTNSTTNNRNFYTSYRNTPTSDRNTPSSDRNTPTSDRNTPSYRNVSTPDRMLRNNGEYYLEHAFNNNNNINIYEEYCEGDEEEVEEDNSYEFEEYSTPCEGVSYASMARKPTIQLPKFMKIDLGAKEVHVRFESWNMVVRIEMNKYYCMVCNKQDHIRYRSEHCISCEHLERLNKCTRVQAFEDYLIRKVDERLYHCGHCNNLQLRNQMEDHIMSFHPKKSRNFIETTYALADNKQDKANPKTVIEPKKTESDKSAILKKEYDSGEPITEPSFDIFGDIPLTPFGCELRIPALNFNLIMKRAGGFYCAVCEEDFVDVIGHVEDLGHVEFMAMTPFIKPFQNHLTRAVKGMLHCSLCNVLFSVSQVYAHNMSQPHTTALAKAMGMKKSQNPVNANRVTILNINNQTGVKNPATSVPNIHNILPFNVTPLLQTTTQQIQKEYLKPVSSDQLSNTQSSLGQNGVMQNAYDPSIGYEAGQTQTGQNHENNGHNLMKLLKVGLPDENCQNLPNTMQNLPNSIQDSSSGHNQPSSRQNLLKSEKSLPVSQNVNIQTIKSVPPMFNSMFPLLPPVNTQALKNQFLGAPLAYNLNAPQPVYPFPNNSPNLLSPNTLAKTTQNKTGKSQNNQEAARKTIVTNKNNTASEDFNSRSGDKIRRESEISRSGSEKIRRESEISKSGSEKIRRESEISRSGSEKIRRESEISRSGSEKIRRDSESSISSSIISKSGNDNIETDSLSEDDDCKLFDEEEMVFLKLKTTYFKITNMSYNTLVFLDNGIRYCFVCSSVVLTSQQQRHVLSRKHTDFLLENKFLDKYGVQLFRQMYLMYHCAICNELMTRKEIKLHLDWSIHVENYNAAHLILNKKNRKELKMGLREYVVGSQKEAIYHNVTEPIYHIRAAYEIVSSLDVKKDTIESRPAKEPSAVVKKNKMVIQNNVVLKISFDHWHGITVARGVTKCVLCQLEIVPDEVAEHVESEYHTVALGTPFEKAYYPALIRKINEATVNCMTCNLEVPSSELMVHEHVSGRKHNKRREDVINVTSHSDTYADCYEDYLNL